MAKILQINITCGRGSTGKLAQALYYETINRGYDAKFAYSVYTPTISDAFRIESKLQNIVRRGLNKYFGKKQCHTNPGTKRLIRYIKREKPDLIHLHNVQQNSVNYSMLFAYLKESKIPIVYTLHDCFAFTGGCFHFTELGCEEYKLECIDCPLKTHPDDISCTARMAYQMKKELIGNNNNIYPICVSHWLKEVATMSYMGNMMHKPETIYNGISTEIFSPKESSIREQYEIGSNVFLVLSVASNWNDSKGLSWLLQLSKMLPENVVLALVGKGLEHIKDNYDHIVCIEHLEDQVQLAQLYSTADVYINTSMEETFGLTTAEAMACGTPAIVINSTACPEIVDKHTGIVINRNFSELLNALLTIKNNGKAAYSKHCVERVKLYFDEKRMVNDYFELYRSILNG